MTWRRRIVRTNPMRPSFEAIDRVAAALSAYRYRVASEAQLHEGIAQALTRAEDAFKSGESKLMLMSLRAGNGIDGLQHVCRTCVFEELDWSPGVIDQNIGRVQRDGQTDPVTAYILVSESGSDPVMTEVLGVKREQLEGCAIRTRI